MPHRPDRFLRGKPPPVNDHQIEPPSPSLDEPSARPWRVTSTWTFQGKSAIVTGGASGIGRALGAALLSEGAHVVLADVDGGAVELAASELTASSRGGTGSVTGLSLDVRDRDAVTAAVMGTIEQHGRLDLLFNNAGISVGGESHEITGPYWDRVIDVNIRGVVNGVVAAYPVMVAQRSGKIVNTASAAGLAPTVLSAPYAMSKHAVVGLSLTLRPEAALHGVQVTALCPGAIETPILDKGAPDDLPPRTDAVLTAREYLRIMRQKPMAADRFALQALRGVARNTAVIVVPGSVKAAWYVQRLSPAAWDRVSRIAARRVLKHMAR